MDNAKTERGTGAPRFRELRELDLLDDFLFQEMVSSPETGEEFCRILLRVILGKEMRKVRITPQRAIQGHNRKEHGVRLDAYIEDISEEELTGEERGLDAEVVQQGDIYDIEPNKVKEKKRLPRKMRYYHGLIDTKLLKAGIDYEKLPRVFIIMILLYDPFDKNRMVYTIKNQCVEDREVSYEDGAIKMFLYTKGTEGNPSQNLSDMLKYIEKSTESHITNPEIGRIDELVREIKENEEVGVSYMKSWEREEYIRRAGVEQGIQQGVRQGMEQKEMQCILSMHEKGYALEEIADVMGKSVGEVKAVIEQRNSVLA